MRLSDLLKTADKPTLTPEQVREGQARIREMRARRGAGKAAPYERGKPLAGGTADQLPQAPAGDDAPDDEDQDAGVPLTEEQAARNAAAHEKRRTEQEEAIKKERADPKNFGKDVKVWDESMGPKHPVPLPETNKYEGRFDYLKRPGSSELMGRYDPEKRTAQPMFYREEDVPSNAPSQVKRRAEGRAAEEAHEARSRVIDGEMHAHARKTLGLTPDAAEADVDEKMEALLDGSRSEKGKERKLKSLGFGDLLERARAEDTSYSAVTESSSRGAFHEAIKKDEVSGWYNPKFAPQEIKMPPGVRASLGEEHGLGARGVKFYERPPQEQFYNAWRTTGPEFAGDSSHQTQVRDEINKGFDAPVDDSGQRGIAMPSSRIFAPRAGPHAGRVFLPSEARLGDVHEGTTQALATREEPQAAFNAGQSVAAKVRAQRYEQMAPQPAAETYPGERRDFARDVFPGNSPNQTRLQYPIWTKAPGSEGLDKSLSNIWRSPEQAEAERATSGPEHPRAFPPSERLYGIETGHRAGSFEDDAVRRNLTAPWKTPAGWWRPAVNQGGDSFKDGPSEFGADATKSKPLPKFDPGADNTKSRELPRFEPKKFEPEDPTKTEAPEEEDSDAPAEREESSKFKPADKGATKHAQLSTILESAYCLSLSKTAGKPGTPNLVFVRGLPGAGKSTWAAKHLPSHTRIEADQFFEGPEGYKFDPARIGDAHADAKARMVEALTSGKDVTVANTFTKKWELDNYLEALGDLKPKTRIFSLGNTPKFQSVHGVPEAALKAMAERWEAIPGERLLGKILKSASEKPIRHRVDVLAMRDGHVLTGKFKDGESHGFFGGGIDEGESPTAAAVRELAEESGFVGENARLLPIKPYLKPYVAEPGFKPSAKMKARTKEYSGTMTHYVAVDVSGKSAKPGTDHKHSFDPKSIGFRPIEEAMPLIAKDHNPERGQTRLAALLAAAEPMQKAAGALTEAAMRESNILARRMSRTTAAAEEFALQRAARASALAESNIQFQRDFDRAAPEILTKEDPKANLKAILSDPNMSDSFEKRFRARRSLKTASGLAAALAAARSDGHISGKLNFNSRPAQASPEQVLDRVMAMRNAGMPGGPKFRNLNKVSALGMLLAG